MSGAGDMAGLPDIPPGYQDLGAEIVGGDRSRDTRRPEPDHHDVGFDVPITRHCPITRH